MTSTAARLRARPEAAALLVVVGLFCQEGGASVAVLLFPLVGAVGMVALRLAFAAIILMLVCRPRLRGRTRGDWMTVVGFGLVLATMNVCFYEALSRLPLGETVTIELLGPLVLSVAISGRRSAWLWAALAACGVVLLGLGSFKGFDALGVVFAVAAAAAWAGYILLSARTGRHFKQLDGLAIAMTVAAIVTLPFGIVGAGPTFFSPSVLALGLAVAVLSSGIPYAFELIALRRLPSATFAIILSLAPAIAALAGFVVLGQRLGPLQAVAIALVVLASAGAVRMSARPAISVS